jgi:NAD(P)H dehydrogenase (quinone)
LPRWRRRSLLASAASSTHRCQIPEGSKVTFAPDHLKTEEAIKASGLAYTIFRNGWYMENLFMALPPAIASGQWFSSAGTGKIAHIARDDIARAIAAGIAAPVPENVTYTLTGPVAYTTDEIAAMTCERNRQAALRGSSH